ncbi:hypothetical protein MAHJHV63_38680 [Mycobacterium avium subsp. hominissuis]
MEADCKRAEHDKTTAAAVARMRPRGDSIKTIALLADVPESQVRKDIRANSGTWLPPPGRNPAPMSTNRSAARC